VDAGEGEHEGEHREQAEGDDRLSTELAQRQPNHEWTSRTGRRLRSTPRAM